MTAKPEAEQIREMADTITTAITENFKPSYEPEGAVLAAVGIGLVSMLAEVAAQLAELNRRLPLPAAKFCPRCSGPRAFPGMACYGNEHQFHREAPSE